MVGLFETDAAEWKVEGIPKDFSFGEIEPDWERIAPFLEKAMARVPASLQVGAKKLFCGPESFTPDLRPIVGEAPELRHYWVAAGLNSIGILTGGGVGQMLAYQMIHGRADKDVTGYLPGRLQPYQATPAYRRARVVESLGKVYKCHYPNRPTETARFVKRSPLHERLVDQGAYFRDVSGWEGADWFAGPGQVAQCGPLTYGRPAWFGQWAKEHRAVREAVGLIDMSFMAKFLVQGRDAGAVLNRLVTADIDGEAGTITYTQVLSPFGTLEADLTITKLPPGSLGSHRNSPAFMVVATDTQQRHVERLLQDAVGEDQAASVTDITGAYAQINLQGPRSRALLARLTSIDISDASFPFRAARRIDLGCASLIATRITYVGELGYELFVPTEMAVHVYDEIVRVGREPEYGLEHCGLKALASLRLEKGYRDYGHDMDNLDTLLEVGLGFTAAYDKPLGFVGREATLDQKGRGAAGLSRRLVSVLLEDPMPLMYQGEIVYRNGRIMGDVRIASYGHSLGGAVGLSMIEGVGEPITAAWVREGQWEVDVAGVRYPARASLRPLYDPENEKLKG